MELERRVPVAIDVVVSRGTQVVTITGPITGGAAVGVVQVVSLEWGVPVAIEVIVAVCVTVTMRVCCGGCAVVGMVQVSDLERGSQWPSTWWSVGAPRWSQSQVQTRGQDSSHQDSGAGFSYGQGWHVHMGGMYIGGCVHRGRPSLVCVQGALRAFTVLASASSSLSTPLSSLQACTCWLVPRPCSPSSMRCMRTLATSSPSPSRCPRSRGTCSASPASVEACTSSSLVLLDEVRPFGPLQIFYNIYIYIYIYTHIYTYFLMIIIVIIISGLPWAAGSLTLTLSSTSAAAFCSTACRERPKLPTPFLLSGFFFPFFLQVGTGTDPVEGAALATAALEWFAGKAPKEEGQGAGGALLTLATTHHGELKMLKYRYLVLYRYFVTILYRYFVKVLYKYCTGTGTHPGHHPPRRAHDAQVQVLFWYISGTVLVLYRNQAFLSSSSLPLCVFLALTLWCCTSVALRCGAVVPQGPGEV